MFKLEKEVKKRVITEGQIVKGTGKERKESAFKMLIFGGSLISIQDWTFPALQLTHLPVLWELLRKAL